MSESIAASAKPTSLVAQLKRDEGLRLTAYKDTTGVWTIGYGHNLEAHPPFQSNCTLEEADTWIERDAIDATEWLARHLPWTEKLDQARQAALQNMAFQLQSRLLQFHRALTLIEDHFWDRAAIELLASLWARQCPERAGRIANQIRTGEWQ